MEEGLTSGWRGQHSEFSYVPCIFVPDVPVIVHGVVLGLQKMSALQWMV